ncbi:hypothetical protein MMC13_007574 [Lambiella insularis]|nr:hypothetical protein [Lambiella insularis]
MAGSLDDLMRFLLEEIALCGQPGALPSQVLAFTEQYFAQQRDLRTAARQSAPFTGQDDDVVHTIDRPYQEHVWRWLTRHPDVRVGHNGEGNRMSLAEVEHFNADIPSLEQQQEGSSTLTASPNDKPGAELAPSPHVEADAPSAGRDRSTGTGNRSLPHVPASSAMAKRRLHVFTSENRMWYAAAGHGPDKEKIAYLEFVCLSIIASHRHRGILQPDLVRATGQDRRSVPLRTQVLCDRGYIVKRQVLAAGSRTSLCILKRFADQATVEDSHRASSSEHSATVVEKTTETPEGPDSNIEQLEPLLRKMFDILKDMKLITWDDLKKSLGIWRNARVSRFLAVSVRKLEYLQCLRRVRAPGDIPKFGGDLHRCIKFLREPTKRDWLYFFDMKRNFSETEVAERQNADDEGEDSLDTGYTVDQSTRVAVGTIGDEIQSSDQLHCKRLSWAPDRLMVNILQDVVQRSGISGMSSMEIKELVVGKFLDRPIEHLISRLVEVWQLSQPLHIRHLAMLRDTTVTGKTAHYIYYAYEAFKSMVDTGKACWEAVETMKPATSKADVSRLAIDASADVDDYGFPRLHVAQFQGRQNDATLAECVSAADIDPVGRREHRPYAPARKRQSSREGNVAQVQEVARNGGQGQSTPKIRGPKGRPRKYPKVGLPVNASELTLDQISTIEVSQKRAKEYEQIRISKEIAARVAEGEEEAKASENVMAEAAARNKADEATAMVVPLNIPTKPRKTAKGIVKKGKPGHSPLPYLPSVAAHSFLFCAGQVFSPTFTAYSDGAPAAPRKRLYRSRRFDSAIGYFPSTIAHMPPGFGTPEEVNKHPQRKKTCRPKVKDAAWDYLPSVAAHSTLDHLLTEVTEAQRGNQSIKTGQVAHPSNSVKLRPNSSPNTANISQGGIQHTPAMPTSTKRKRKANNENPLPSQPTRKRNRISQPASPGNGNGQTYSGLSNAPYVPSTAAHTRPSFETFEVALSFGKASDMSQLPRARKKTAKVQENEGNFRALGESLRSKVGDRPRPHLTYEEQRSLIVPPTTGICVGILADLKSASKSGRPRRTRLALFKSQRLVDFPWFGSRLPLSEGPKSVPVSIATSKSLADLSLPIEGSVSQRVLSAGMANTSTAGVRPEATLSALSPVINPPPAATASLQSRVDFPTDVRAVVREPKTPPVEHTSTVVDSTETLPHISDVVAGPKRKRKPSIVISPQSSQAIVLTNDRNSTSPILKRLRLEKSALPQELQRFQTDSCSNVDDHHDLQLNHLAHSREKAQEAEPSDRIEPSSPYVSKQTLYLAGGSRAIPIASTSDAVEHSVPCLEGSQVLASESEKVGEAQEVEENHDQDGDNETLGIAQRRNISLDTHYTNFNITQSSNYEALAVFDRRLIDQDTACSVSENSLSLLTTNVDMAMEVRAKDPAITIMDSDSRNLVIAASTTTWSEGRVSDQLPVSLIIPAPAAKSAASLCDSQSPHSPSKNVRAASEADPSADLYLMPSSSASSSHQTHECVQSGSQNYSEDESLTVQVTATKGDLPPSDFGSFPAGDTNNRALPKDNANGQALRVSRVTTSGGSVAILRRNIIMEIVERCGGVFPGDTEIWLPFSEAWMLRTDAGKPDQKTVLAAMKYLVDVGKLRKLKFTFNNYMGIATTKSIVTSVDIVPTDPKIKDLQKKIMEQKSRAMYIPDEASLSGTKRPSGLQKKAAWLVRKGVDADRAWPEQLGVEKEQVKIQHVPERLKGISRKRGRSGEASDPMKLRRVSSDVRAKRKKENLLRELEEALDEPDFAIPDYRHSEDIVPSEGASLSKFRWRESRLPVDEVSESRVRRLSRLRTPTEMHDNSLRTKTHTILPSGGRLMRLSSKPLAVSHQITVDRHRDELGGVVDAFLKSRPHSSMAAADQDTNSGPGDVQQHGNKSSQTPIAGDVARAEFTDHTTSQVRFVDVLGLYSNFDTDSQPDFDDSEAHEGQPLFIDRTLDRLEPPGNGDRLDLAPGNGHLRFRPRKLPAKALQKNMDKQLREIGRRYELLSQKRRRTMNRARGQQRPPATHRRNAEPVTFLMDADHVFHVSTGTFSTKYAGMTGVADVSNITTVNLGSIYHEECASDLPRSLEDILSRTKDVGVNNKSFFKQVDKVAKWELKTPSLANARSQDWRFINLHSPGSGKADSEAFENITYLEESFVKNAPKRSYRRKLTRMDLPAVIPAKRTAAVSRSSTFQAPSLVNTVPSNGGEAVEELSDANGRFRKTVRLRGPKVPKTSPNDDRRIMMSVIVVRTLVGGMEQNIDWVLLARMFAPKFSETILHYRWVFMRDRHRLSIEKIQADFQEMFVQAYEDGIIAPLNFDDYDDYDWNWLLDWTLETFDAQKNLVKDLPRSRKALNCQFELRSADSRDMADFYEIDAAASIPRRRVVASRSPYVIPLVGSASPDAVPSCLEIAKSWVRANVITPDQTYVPKVARKTLEVFGHQNIEAAEQELARAKVIIRESKRYHLKGRNYDISEQCLSHLRKKLGEGHFRQAEAYHTYLNHQFQVEGLSDFSWNAADGDVMAVLNLAAHGRIQIVPKNPPFEKYGLVDNGYRTRHMDRRRLHFSIELRPTASYTAANPVLPFPPPPRPVVSVESSSAGPFLQAGGTVLGDPGKLPKLPAWIDINREVVWVMWKLALAAVVSIVAIRPGVSAKELEISVRPSLEAWEIQSIMSWCVQAGIAAWADEDDGQSGSGGIRLKEWWWTILEHSVGPIAEVDMAASK